LKRVSIASYRLRWMSVAFTPKGGCPLKLFNRHRHGSRQQIGSIHPQGWVPIETVLSGYLTPATGEVAFTPKGGCPLKLLDLSNSLVVS